jgi:hypothetical protein
MSRLSTRARDRRENALKQGLTETLGSDAWLDEEPDLYYALDEIVASDELLLELAQAAGATQRAQRIQRDRRRAEDRGVGDRTDVEETVVKSDLRVDEALDAYAEALAAEHLDDCRSWLSDDVTLADLRGDDA